MLTNELLLWSVSYISIDTISNTENKCNVIFIEIPFMLCGWFILKNYLENLPYSCPISLDLIPFQLELTFISNPWLQSPWRTCCWMLRSWVRAWIWSGESAVCTTTPSSRASTRPAKHSWTNYRKTPRLLRSPFCFFFYKTLFKN